MLKPFSVTVVEWQFVPAAFRRLCVETQFYACRLDDPVPAAFRRLCVETMMMANLIY